MESTSEPAGNMVPPAADADADRPHVKGGLSIPRPDLFVVMPDGERVPADWMRELWWAEEEIERLCARYPEGLTIEDLLQETREHART